MVRLNHPLVLKKKSNLLIILKDTFLTMLSISVCKIQLMISQNFFKFFIVKTYINNCKKYKG